MREKSHPCDVWNWKSPPSLHEAGNLEVWTMVAKRQKLTNWKREMTRNLIYLQLEIEHEVIHSEEEREGGKKANTYEPIALRGFPGSSAGIHLQCRRPMFHSWVGKICWRRDRLPAPVFLGFPCVSAGKEFACNVGDLSLIPGLGRSLGEGNGYPLQCVHGVTKKWQESLSTLD